MKSNVAKVSPGVAVYIVDYVTSTNQKRQADVLVVNQASNIHGAVFGIAVSKSTDLRIVRNVMKYLIAKSF